VTRYWFRLQKIQGISCASNPSVNSVMSGAFVVAPNSVTKKRVLVPIGRRLMAATHDASSDLACNVGVERQSILGCTESGERRVAVVVKGEERLNEDQMPRIGSRKSSNCFGVERCQKVCSSAGHPASVSQVAYSGPGHGSFITS